MDAARPIISEWYVAFVDNGVNIWWQRFLAPGFRHCFAFSYDAQADAWLILDVGFEGIHVQAISRAERDALIVTVLEAGGRIVRARCQRHRVRLPRLLASCVSATAHLLGLRGCALTPKQLWRRLLAAGAVPAFEGARHEIVRRRVEDPARSRA